MSRSMSAAELTTPDRNFVTDRPQMLKAGLPETTALSSLVTDTAKRVYGKQGAAAAQIGKDEGNFSRDVKAGRTTLADLERLGPQYLAELGRELVEQYAPLATPKARIQQKAREQRALADELESIAEYL